MKQSTCILIGLIGIGVIGLLFSGFYGWKAVQIFDTTKTKEELKKLSWEWKIHQSWLNFSGSLVGWIVLLSLLVRHWQCLLDACTVPFGIWDFVACVVAFVGVTGYLPMSIVGFISGLGLLGSKVGELLGFKS